VIAYVAGTVAQRESGRVIIDVGGVGIEVAVPDSTARRLPEPGRPVKLLTTLLVREDHWQLVGFATTAEREVFGALLDVSGVGPKLALAVVGHLGADGVRRAVAAGEWKRLKEVPGVGARIAQRLVVELKPLFGDVDADGSSEDVGAGEDEVAEALVGLGYTTEEALWALAQVSATDPAERLRQALSQLDRRKGTGHAR
jgi:Holliday junction DNA helicase RuvA